METTTQVFSSKYCEIFKISFFIEYLRWFLLLLAKRFKVTDHQSSPRIQPCYHTLCITVVVILWFDALMRMLLLQTVFSESVSMTFKRFRCHCEINFVTLWGIKAIRGREGRWDLAYLKKIDFFLKFKYFEIFKSVHRYCS